MSVPYRIVTCTSCNLQEASLILNGYFVWRDSQNRETSFDRELGICRDCCTVTPIERLPDRDEFDEAEEAFLAQEIFEEEDLSKLLEEEPDPGSD